jgi:hypothetical protein
MVVVVERRSGGGGWLPGPVVSRPWQRSPITGRVVSDRSATSTTTTRRTGWWGARRTGGQGGSLVCRTGVVLGVHWYKKDTCEPAPGRHSTTCTLSGRSAIGSGWHRSANIVFDCGTKVRRAAWGASVPAHGSDDPAASWTVLAAECLLVPVLVLVLACCVCCRPPRLLRPHEPSNLQRPAAHLVCFLTQTHHAAGPGHTTPCPCPSGIGHPAPQEH